MNLASCGEHYGGPEPEGQWLCLKDETTRYVVNDCICWGESWLEEDNLADLIWVSGLLEDEGIVYKQQWFG